MTEYHYLIQFKMGCGCHFATAIDLPEGEEPEPESEYFALCASLAMPDVAFLLANSHEDHGEESLDISVRAKVGPAPDEMPPSLRGEHE